MNKEEIKQRDKEDKAIKFYTNYIQAQEKELDWMQREDEEYYRDEIEQKELLIKGFRTILNLIQKQENIIDKMAEKIDKFNSSSGLDEDCFITREYSSIDDCIKKQSCKECIKEYFNKEVEKDVKD